MTANAMNMPPARPYRTTFFRNGLPIRDSWTQFGAVVTLLAFAAVICLGIQWPTATATREMLRQAYSGQHVRITTFKSVGMETSCGYYILGSDPAPLRYYKSQSGLVAERTPNQWRAYSSDHPYEDRWDGCKNEFGRGHTLDFVTDPLVVALLGAT